MTEPSPTAGPDLGSVAIDTTVAHQGRVYDYLAGGEANFAVDREVADMQARAYGNDDGTIARRDIRSNRDFIGRAIDYLVGEAGIRQVLDIGTGIPNEDDLHGSQQSPSDTRMVFVDNDDIVVAHAHQLLASASPAPARFIKGDFYDSDAVLASAGELLDLTQPTALMLVALVHLHADELQPHRTVARYMEALPSGSFLVMSHLSSDIAPASTDALAKAAQDANADYGFHLRSQAEFGRFFDGLELVEPGVVPVTAWRTESDFVAPFWAAVGRKP